MINPLSKMFCSHLWEEVEDPSAKAVKDTITALTYCDVQCQKCGKRTRMTRKDYIQHVVATKRLVG